MKLFTREWGEGDKLALLIHGGTSDSRTWRTVAPELVRRGYRVLAPDLRGHGRSPRGEYGDPDAYVRDLVETLPVGAHLALGHSLGGLFLSLAAEQLRPTNLVLSEPGYDQDIKPADFFDSVRQALPLMNSEILRAAHPRWADEDIDIALEASSLLDLDLLAGLKSFRGRNYLPERASGHALLQLAGIGSTVKPETAAEMARRGFTVRVVEHAGHDIHNDDFDGFFASMDGFV